MAALDDVVGGRGRLFLIGGEPGIGKSALADEIASRARERGVRVLSGRCWEAGGAPPYWPWVQSIRSLLEGLDDPARRSLTGPFAKDLAQMLPEIGTPREAETELTTIDPDTARFRLFDATAGLLRSVASKNALLVTLEDLHAADTPSLLLLEFVARALGDSRILIVGTYRDVEVVRGHPLASTLPELAREAVTRRISLAGLRAVDVDRFIAESAGVRPSAGLVDAVHRETEGNPLFIGEIVRLLVSEGRLTGDPEAAIKPIPQGIRDVIARRVGHISERCNHVLEIASVLGREFTLDVLGELSERPADELLEILDEATAARLVSETPGVLGGMRFSHSLIRDTMYEEMSASRRVRLHRRAGELLEQIRKGDPEHLTEIAHHFLAAAPTGETSKAIHYARVAAEHALQRLAFEESARLFEMALQALQLGDQFDERTRFELLLSLGDALTRAGDAESARTTAIEVADIARRHGDADGLGHAALLYGGMFSWSALRGDPRFIPLLEEALAAVTAAGENLPLKVKLMGRLAAGPWRDHPDREGRIRLASDALEIARGLDDPSTLAFALEAYLGAIVAPIELDRLLEVSEEIERTAAAAGDGEKMLMSHFWRILVHLYRGEMPQTLAERHAIARLAEQLRQGPQNWFVLCTDAALAFFAGRFDEAETLAEKAYEAGRRAEPYALFAFRLQMLWTRMEQGRESEVMEDFVDSMEEFKLYPVWRALSPYLLLAFASKDRARAAFKETFPTPRPMNEEYLLAAGVLGDAAAEMGSRDEAEVMYDELLPFAALTMGGLPDINMGATARVLGRLAHTLGRFDDAERHFAEAIESNDRMGGRPWAAWARHDFARMLEDRGGPGDRERAAVLLAEAEEAAAELGMVRLRRAIVGEDATPSPSEQPPKADRLDSRFVREGEYWSVVYEGTEFRIRDSKGVGYIATLLASPGREFHALDLVGPGGSGGTPAREDELTARALGDAGEILDPEAKAAYRARLSDLEETIEEARAWGDDERAARANEEREALLGQLAGAVGLGGRDRRAASASERARVNVTRAIKSAVARIAEQSPALGAHLDATLRTGTFCTYTPDPRSQTVWKT